MPHNAAACITALRAAMEALVVEVTKEPSTVRQLDPANEQMLNVIRQISRLAAAGISLMAPNARLAGLRWRQRLELWGKERSPPLSPRTRRACTEQVRAVSSSAPSSHRGCRSPELRSPESLVPRG